MIRTVSIVQVLLALQVSIIPSCIYGLQLDCEGNEYHAVLEIQLDQNAHETGYTLVCDNRTIWDVPIGSLSRKQSSGPWKVEESCISKNTSICNFTLSDSGKDGFTTGENGGFFTLLLDATTIAYSEYGIEAPFTKQSYCFGTDCTAEPVEQIDDDSVIDATGDESGANNTWVTSVNVTNLPPRLNNTSNKNLNETDSDETGSRSDWPLVNFTDDNSNDNDKDLPLVNFTDDKNNDKENDEDKDEPTTNHQQPHDSPNDSSNVNTTTTKIDDTNKTPSTSSSSTSSSPSFSMPIILLIVVLMLTGSIVILISCKMIRYQKAAAIAARNQESRNNLSMSTTSPSVAVVKQHHMHASSIAKGKYDVDENGKRTNDDSDDDGNHDHHVQPAETFVTHDCSV